LTTVAPAPPPASEAGGPALATSTRRLLDAPVVPTLLRLAAPNVAEAVARIAFITFDAYFVGWLGAEALAGVSLVFPFFILMQTMSAGGMGGGVSAAIARALGAGRRDEAHSLVMHAGVIALVMAAAFTSGLLLFGPALYRTLGGSGASLQLAIVYSNVVFAGSIAVWTMNTLANVVRGTGNMVVPASAIIVAALVHLALSPALILGLGPFPDLGVAGAGAAVVVSYIVGSFMLIAYLASGRGLVRFSIRERSLQGALFAEILRVGVPSALNTVQFQLLIVVVTGLVSGFGTFALAGYGVALRLEMVQIPLIFGFGSALVAMVGTNVGAGRGARARRIAWVGAAIGAVVGGLFGLTAVFPDLWMARFTADAEVMAVGARYLRMVAPVYPLFGAALALFFASQGAGRVLWPFLAVTSRLVITAAVGWTAVHVLGAGLTAVFAIVAAGLVVMSAGIVIVVKLSPQW
jgi:putative MATE family efflux protein